MGYDFYTNNSNVRIASKDIPKAVELLHAANFGAGEDNIEYILNDEGWSVDYDDGGSINCLWTDENVLQDDKEMLTALIPVVADGSYIDCTGEDNDHWEWLFRDGNLHEYAGRVVFENDVERLREMLSRAEAINAERSN